jgi:hypothetical protein
MYLDEEGKRHYDKRERSVAAKISVSSEFVLSFLDGEGNLFNEMRLCFSSHWKKKDTESAKHQHLWLKDFKIAISLASCFTHQLLESA